VCVAVFASGGLVLRLAVSSRVVAVLTLIHVANVVYGKLITDWF